MKNLTILRLMENRMKFYYHLPILKKHKINLLNRYFNNIFLLLMTCFSLMLTSIAFAQPASFPTAEKAAEKLYEAVLARDAAQVKELFGKEHLYLLALDEVEEEERVLFLDAWKKSHQLISTVKDKKFIKVGSLGWTFPIPIVKNKVGWSFDALSGAEIIKTRRIGRNELYTIQAVLAYFDAQKEYASQDRNNNGMLEYAQKFVSSENKKDGLYWPVKADEVMSPLGSLFANDTDKEGYQGYHGYHYKILKGQSKNADGGAYSYLSNNKMRFGFALIAWPAKYNESGIISFIINQDGILYEKDLGEKTDQVAEKIDFFDPSEVWIRSDVTP
jgi:hypothetical protein